MTNSTSQSSNYINQGQQDDYFNQDISIAGHEPQPHAVELNDINQGQQDDYFDRDITTAGDEAE